MAGPEDADNVIALFRLQYERYLRLRGDETTKTS
jgi:hypothetical protein